jgi:hypothetical protein
MLSTDISHLHALEHKPGLEEEQQLGARHRHGEAKSVIYGQTSILYQLHNGLAGECCETAFQEQ